MDWRIASEDHTGSHFTATFDKATGMGQSRPKCYDLRHEMGLWSHTFQLRPFTHLKYFKLSFNLNRWNHLNPLYNQTVTLHSHCFNISFITHRNKGAQLQHAALQHTLLTLHFFIYPLCTTLLQSASKVRHTTPASYQSMEITLAALSLMHYFPLIINNKPFTSWLLDGSRFSTTEPTTNSPTTGYNVMKLSLWWICHFLGLINSFWLFNCVKMREWMIYWWYVISSAIYW